MHYAPSKARAYVHLKSSDFLCEMVCIPLHTFKREFNEKDDDIHTIHISSLHWYKMLFRMCVCMCLVSLLLTWFFSSVKFFFFLAYFCLHGLIHISYGVFSCSFASSSIEMVVSDLAISYLAGSFFIWNSLHCLTPAWNICIHRVRRICDYKYRNNEAVKRAARATAAAATTTATVATAIAAKEQWNRRNYRICKWAPYSNTEIVHPPAETLIYQSSCTHILREGFSK